MAKFYKCQFVVVYAFLCRLFLSRDVAVVAGLAVEV